MLAVIYILLSVWLGTRVAQRLFAPVMMRYQGNRFWSFAVFSFGSGTLLLTWCVYLFAWILHVVFQVEKPLIPSNILCMGAVLIWACISIIAKRKSGTIQFTIENPRLFRKEAVFYGILLLFVMFTMTYVFHVTDGVLYSGYTVFGDYAPHTAMMRSFSKHANFPTQYPHFGGEDIKYHFFFQFLIGNLEFLGMRLDIAYNLLGTLSLVGFLILLCQIAYRISGSFAAGVIASVCFVFRSGTAFFQFVLEHLQAGDLLQTLRENTSFIGYTQNENWGLWNYNVYLNQRHLGFGLLILAGLVWIYLDTILDTEKGIPEERWVRGRIFSLEVWESQNWKNALLGGILLGLTAFWNGAAVIGCLLILFGMAVFGTRKIDYLITATVAVIISYLQTKFFISGTAVATSFYWGFISTDKTLPGVLLYLIQITGVTVIGLWLISLFLEREQRLLIFSFSMPVFFAFCMSLTPDVTVNHKYIMIAMAMMGIVWGHLIASLWKYGIFPRIFCLVLCCVLTATGVYDFGMIIRGNGTGRRLGVQMNSVLTNWLEENLTEQDLILTPEYSMNEVTMSGVMLYCGWPYYAWSAGYDTYSRAAKAALIYSTTDAEELTALVKEEKITYILYEEGMSFESHETHEDLIAEEYPCVFESEDGRIRIYETKEAD